MPLPKVWLMHPNISVLFWDYLCIWQNEADLKFVHLILNLFCLKHEIIIQIFMSRKRSISKKAYYFDNCLVWFLISKCSLNTKVLSYTVYIDYSVINPLLENCECNCCVVFLGLQRSVTKVKNAPHARMSLSCFLYILLLASAVCLTVLHLLFFIVCCDLWDHSSVDKYWPIKKRTMLHLLPKISLL